MSSHNVYYYDYRLISDRKHFEVVIRWRDAFSALCIFCLEIWDAVSRITFSLPSRPFRKVEIDTDWPSVRGYTFVKFACRTSPRRVCHSTITANRYATFGRIDSGRSFLLLSSLLSDRSLISLYDFKILRTPAKFIVLSWSWTKSSTVAYSFTTHRSSLVSRWCDFRLKIGTSLIDAMLER